MQRLGGPRRAPWRAGIVVVAVAVLLAGATGTAVAEDPVGEPLPVEPAPVELAPVEPAPVEPVPVEAPPVEPAPVDAAESPVAPLPAPTAGPNAVAAASASGDVSALAVTASYSPAPAVPGQTVTISWSGCPGDGEANVRVDAYNPSFSSPGPFGIGGGTGASPIQFTLSPAWANIGPSNPPWIAFYSATCTDGPGTAGGDFFSLANGATPPTPPVPPTNQAPVAGFTAEPITPDWDLFRFTSTATDPDAGDSITSHTWDFGDGKFGTGTTVLNNYAKPGTYTVTHRVVDSHGLASISTQDVVVRAPTLRLSVELPDNPTGRVAPGGELTARVTVAANDDGHGDLSQVRFDGGVLRADPADLVTVVGGPEPAVPENLTLSPGEARSFDVRLRADRSGTFSLNSHASAVDAAGRAVAPVTASAEGVVSGLTVTLDVGRLHEDAVDVVMNVRNDGGTAIEGLTYPGGGIAAHPEYVPVSRRGAVTRTAGPTPALPSRLEPGQEAAATFRFRADKAGVVVVVGEATAIADGVAVGDTDVGEIVAERGLERRALTAADLREVFIALIQGELENLRAQALAGQEALSLAMNNVIREARAQGVDIAPKPAGYGPAPLLDIDNVQLTAVAIAGYVNGIGRGVLNTADFVIGTPAQYYAAIVSDLDLGRAARDFWEAGVAAGGLADSAAYGVFSTAFQLYGGAEEFLATGQLESNNPESGKYADLLESLADNHQGLELREAALPAQMDAHKSQIDQYLDQLQEEVLEDPYAWAHSATREVGVLTGEELLGEGIVRGGAKLLELTTQAWQYSKFGKSGAALDRLTTGETLETLGVREISLADAERLGGFSQRDSAQVQEVIAEVKEKFGVDLEIQARPSNVHSVQYINSELGAIGKPELFKAKNLSDIDVFLGADPSGLGKLGVYQPKRPPESVLAKLPTDLRTEVELRFNTQQAVWTDWNDPASKFRKNFDLATKQGGHTFEFKVPGPESNAPRTYHTEVDVAPSGRNNTVTFFERTTGRPFVSDIDFHAYFKANGQSLDAGTRGQIELYLQKRWKDTGIAFGDHGATLNGFDWPGSGAGGAAVARHKFALEFLHPDEALVQAQLKSAQLGVPVEELMSGFVPGKFVVSFRHGSIYTGPGTTF